MIINHKLKGRVDRSKICQAEASGRVDQKKCVFFSVKIMGINIVKHWDRDYAVISF